MDEEDLMDVFFGKLPNNKYLNLTLDCIIENIEQVRKTPKEQRHYEFWTRHFNKKIQTY